MPFWIRAPILVEMRNTPANLSIRPSGLVGLTLCFVAGIVFSHYDDTLIAGDEHG